MRLVLATAVLALASVSAQAVQYTAQRLSIPGWAWSPYQKLTDTGILLVTDQRGPLLVTANGQTSIPGNRVIYLDVNNTGTAVGSMVLNGKQVGSMFSNGTVQDMSSQWHGGTAVAINNSGVVAGEYTVNDAKHGFIWSATDGFRDIGASYAIHDIDERGRVLGENDWWVPHSQSAFIWSEGVRTDTGPLSNPWPGPSYAPRRFGAQGEVIGIYGYVEGIYPWAERDGVALDTYNLQTIVGIDSAGRMIGTQMVYENGIGYDIATFLPPNPSNNYQVLASSDNGKLFVVGNDYFLLSPVPEPATYTMVLLGIVVTAGFARRRRRG